MVRNRFKLSFKCRLLLCSASDNIQRYVTTNDVPNRLQSSLSFMPTEP